MKKALLIIVIAIITLYLFSCKPKSIYPYGVWESQSPHMIIYLETGKSDHGIYYQDGKEIEVIIMQEYSGIIDIHNISAETKGFYGSDN